MKKTLILVIALFSVFSSVSHAFCESMLPKNFEKKVATFSDRVVDGQNFNFVAAKKELLGDLYVTVYEQDFYPKYDSIVRYSSALSFDIEKKLSVCKSSDEFRAVKDRYAEWNDFCRLADRAPSDYAKGVIQELTIDKKRETALPFEVGSAKWEPDSQDSEEIQTYKKELAKAEKIVAKALSSLKSNNEDDFAALFSEKFQLFRKAEPETSEIHKIFKQERDEYWQEKMSAEIAPMFVRYDLEEAARMLKEKQIVKAVIRRWDGGNASFAEVQLEKPVGKDYIIASWARGLDLQNRKHWSNRHNNFHPRGTNEI